MKNRIGIVGGGQLGRMMAFEAHKMGFRLIVLDPTPRSPAGQVADEQIVANYSDQKALQELATKSDVITYEIELENSDIFDGLVKTGSIIHPSIKTFKLINDKYLQKEFFQKAKIPVADFMAVENKEDILKATKKFGYPILLKTRLFAYDGRGNALIKKASDIEKQMNSLQGKGLYVEKYIPFIKELAVMVARNTKGEIATYQVVETIHKNNILHVVKAPAAINSQISLKARNLAKNVMQHLKGAGVFGIEMFLTKSRKVLVNEIAPRVHNSGHYTIEACVTNQFAQHIRAISGLPLGKTDMLVGAAVMINILGERAGSAEVSGIEKALGLPQTYVHIYGKKDTKMERKMGHITAVDKSLEKAYKKAKLARKLISI
ncbi:MAG: Phosphoribosylaminoimidazole carboxylase, ATPase subunit [Candidatus Gottesmanbacteria bacterium GW2011_GWB1_43_11]|uniref:N5-carboxyaminoimidazole ribonucleotide synthase n=1 Tax=Candidatus Gottesmanbacteria bacterium GW2011_GWB1_43_11 TaxID=1618446 RepID=A0A0G1CK96_9BACT|nr:MAG: Phosphoribosylaminoimidazole carboxylase, ATPase subunit [Candidatus Gottesmanbacteria bacterium GW2011_GWC1_43_10]KKS85907.1 MAG: Phosphoribosylaminoimidazole carboxylase, ATPase subunit [Candidatus Gottesmanbacteria bacterium GW2011_GWB1_43_11]